MPEHPSGDDPALAKALAQLDLDQLPEPLYAAVAAALEWVHLLDREAAEQDVRRPR